MAFLSLSAAGVFALILFGLGLVARSLPGMASDGLEAPRWLTQYHWAKPAIMIMGLWMAVGSNNMLLYIAGISNIPQELYEAADIDGASRWQRFWNVTWPQLAPTTFFIAIMSMIGGIQGGFEQARTMTKGGPFGATTTLSYYVYQEGFETLRQGYASAVAWVVFLIIISLTILNYRFGSRYAND
jgi:multiple sugar transport system permease protein